MTDLTRADLNLIQRILYEHWQALDWLRPQQSGDDYSQTLADQHHLEAIREKLSRVEPA